jgi:DNA-binding beta-propeller fold protein YncE
VAALAGCTGGGMGGGTGGDDGSGGDTRPPMTNGVSTLAGWSMPGYLDGDRQVNLFNNPTNVAYGPDNKLYVADFDNGKIRVIDMDGNATTLIAKQGFARPFGLAFVGDTLYVSTDRDPQGQGGSTDLMSGTVWKIDVAARSATPIAARIGRPRGLAALSDGRLAVADYEHHVIQLLDPASGTLTPLAGAWDLKGFADGAGAAAQFSTPYAVAQRSDGKLVVTDFDNHRIRLVGLDGSVTTAAGSSAAGFADGAMSGAMFNHPQGLVKTASGDMYLTDIDNYRVRKISADFASISTIAGDGTPGYKDDDTTTAAQFYGLEGVSVKPDGSMIFVADGTRGEDVPYNRIRVIKN